MAMRIRIGQYEVEEAIPRRRRWFALIGGVIAGLVVVGSQGFSAGSPACELGEELEVPVSVPVPAVFSSASWRSDGSDAAGQVRRVVYREPVLLGELVNPRVYENLQGVAICPVGVSREWDEPRAVRAPFRVGEAAVTHLSKTRSGESE